MEYRVNRVIKLRSKPTQDSPDPHGRVDPDDIVTIIAGNNDWRKVRVVDKFGRTHREGFIKASFLIEKDPIETQDEKTNEVKPTFALAPFHGSGKPLTQEILNTVCEDLHIKEAVVWAVLAVETHGFGFFENRKPRILFERHVFHRQTNGEFGSHHPDISNDNSGGYVGGIKEYERLEKAIILDREVALMSTSWGIGQVMGFNFQSVGFASVEKMVDAMIENEDKQLLAMMNFIKDHGLENALQRKNWELFARGYNGAGFKKNDYDTRLAAANAKYEIKRPDLKLRSAQTALSYLGFKPGPVDGLRGRRTHSGLVKFQEQAGLLITGDLNEQTEVQLMKTAWK